MLRTREESRITSAIAKILERERESASAGRRERMDTYSVRCRSIL